VYVLPSEITQTNSSISTSEYWVDLWRSTITWLNVSGEFTTIFSRYGTSTTQGRYVNCMIWSTELVLMIHGTIR